MRNMLLLFAATIVCACQATPLAVVHSRQPNLVVEGNGTVTAVADCLYPIQVQEFLGVIGGQTVILWSENHTIAEVVSTSGNQFFVSQMVRPTERGVAIESRLDVHDEDGVEILRAWSERCANTSA